MGKHQERKQGIENKYPTWPFVVVTSDKMNCVFARPVTIALVLTRSEEEALRAYLTLLDHSMRW